MIPVPAAQGKNTRTAADVIFSHKGPHGPIWGRYLMKDKIDLFLFVGQSNMAGRGDAEIAEKPIEGAAYEFRAVSDDRRLYPLQEPFGKFENREDGINDRWGSIYAKSGDLVSAFTNMWFKRTGTSIVGVSASKGGSSIKEWIPGTKYHQDMLSRLDRAVSFLQHDNIEIGHVYALFCQGETDGDLKTDKDQYKAMFKEFLSSLKEHGIEKIFVILIGKCNIEGKYDSYDEIRKAQEELSKENEDVVIVSRLLETFLEKGLMKDEFHYFQKGYDIVGRDAAQNAADHIISSIGKAWDQA